MARVYGRAASRTPAEPKQRLWLAVLVRTSAAAILRGRVNIRLLLLLGIVAMFYYWGSPHLRWSYAFYGTREHPTYTRCDYLGWNSFRAYGPQCPLVIWRPWR